MAKMQWAKFPTQWLKPPVSADGSPQRSVLTELLWARHAGSAIAAILVLIALAIRLNQSQKDQAFDGAEKRGASVAATFEELRNMTGLAKSSISSALMLLEAFAAIEIERSGRANSYKLLGLEVPGGWCMLPHGWLLKRDGTLKFKKIPRNRVTLNALKAYLLLMHLRDRSLNTAAVGYTTIERWTAIRREDISTALGMLAALQLVMVSPERDFRHSKGDNSHRYSIIGLGYGRSFLPDDDLVTSEVTATESVYITPEMSLVRSLTPQSTPAPAVGAPVDQQRASVLVVPNAAAMGIPEPRR
ncbi:MULTISPECIES: hypothetical protein [unclassified Variovorax]|uniref:hypothetical protein n=1 Tax=unclassified Variovorax TaxID=663243 RepID=UPI003F46A49D